MALLCSELQTHSMRKRLGEGTEPSGVWLRLEGASLSRPGWGLGADTQPRVPVGEGGLSLSKALYQRLPVQALIRYPIRCSLLVWMDVRTGGEWHPWSQRH